MPKLSEMSKNNIHVYLYPFVGNTLQGTQYTQYFKGIRWDYAVIGTWTNKHNKGGLPEKFKIVEDWDQWTEIKMGSLSRTIAHGVGHVLNLQHRKCEGNCLMGSKRRKGKHGYKLSLKQIIKARISAIERITNK